MRSYTVAAAAVTLQVTPKWLDNTLSHNQVAGVVQSRQGVSRRLTPHAVLTLHIAQLLTRNMAVPLWKALEIAAGLSSARGSSARIRLTPAIVLEADVESMTREVASRLASAVEITPVPRRGRPSAR